MGPTRQAEGGLEFPGLDPEDKDLAGFRSPICQQPPGGPTVLIQPPASGNTEHQELTGRTTQGHSLEQRRGFRFRLAPLQWEIWSALHPSLPGGSGDTTLQNRHTCFPVRRVLKQDLRGIRALSSPSPPVHWPCPYFSFPATREQLRQARWDNGTCPQDLRGPQSERFPMPDSSLCTQGSAHGSRGHLLGASRNSRPWGQRAGQGQPSLGGKQGSHPSVTKGLCPPH